MRYGSRPGWLEDSFLDIRLMSIDSDFYKSFRNKLHARFDDEASSILYDIGLDYGETIGRNITKMGASNVEVYRKFLDRGRSHGLGDFSTPYLKMIISGLRGEPVIMLRDSFFAHAVGKTGKSECNLVAGMIAGAASAILRKGKMACVEEKCLSKGDDYCEFRLASERVWGNEETPRLSFMR